MSYRCKVAGSGLAWSALAGFVLQGGGCPLALADPALPFAAPAAAAAGAASRTTGLGQVTLALALVLLAIFAFAWVARRLRAVGRTAGGAIEVLGDVALGQKERAVLIRVGSARLLVGVAPGQVRTLHVLGEEPGGTTRTEGSGAATEGGSFATTGSFPGPSRPNFRALLMKSLGR